MDEFGFAATQAICGRILQQVNPEFNRNLDAFDQRMPSLFKGFSKWMIPNSYAVRDKVLENIKEWHSIARTQLKKSSIDPDEDFDPYWGSEFIRTRQDSFASIDNFDLDAYAASALGFIWAYASSVF